MSRPSARNASHHPSAHVLPSCRGASPSRARRLAVLSSHGLPTGGADSELLRDLRVTVGTPGAAAVAKISRPTRKRLSDPATRKRDALDRLTESDARASLNASRSN